MNVDKRYKMYGIMNATHCTSMLLREWSGIKDYVLDKYGGGMHIFKPLLAAETIFPVPKNLNYWYIENDDGVITVYFPTNDDIEYINKCKTLGALK